MSAYFRTRTLSVDLVERIAARMGRVSDPRGRPIRTYILLQGPLRVPLQWTHVELEHVMRAALGDFVVVLSVPHPTLETFVVVDFRAPDNPIGVVVFDPDACRLEVSAAPHHEVALYARAFGTLLYGEPGAFVPRAVVSSDPLQLELGLLASVHGMALLACDAQRGTLALRNEAGRIHIGVCAPGSISCDAALDVDVRRFLTSSGIVTSAASCTT